MIRIDHGGDAVQTLQEAAGLIDAASEAFSTSSTWYVVAATTLPGDHVVISVRDAGRVVALAALTRHTRHGVARIEMLASEYNDYAGFALEDPTYAPGLAAAIASWVRSHRRWSLSLQQLPEHDPTVAALRTLLPEAQLAAGPPMPRISGIGTTYQVSRNRRRNVNNAINRAVTDGRSAHTLTLTELPAIDAWLDRVMVARRGRDNGIGRRSHLDLPGVEDFLRGYLRAAAAEGRVILHLFVIDGTELGGYGIVLVDGDAHRMFDGRVAHEHQRYKGGVVSDVEAAVDASVRPEIVTFDWLRGSSEAKFGNDVLHRYGLVATSHRALARADRLASRSRGLVKAALPHRVRERLVTARDE
ncbi:GNAT family N-acetyltransferase [Nocardioides ultimimeridianus]